MCLCGVKAVFVSCTLAQKQFVDVDPLKSLFSACVCFLSIATVKVEGITL